MKIVTEIGSGTVAPHSPPFQGGVSSLSIWGVRKDEARELSPSRIKNGAHSDRDFHADLLFQRIARKTGGKRKMMRRTGIIEGIQFGTEAGNELSGAKTERWFGDAPVG